MLPLANREATALAFFDQTLELARAASRLNQSAVFRPKLRRLTDAEALQLVITIWTLRERGIGSWD